MVRRAAWCFACRARPSRWFFTRSPYESANLMDKNRKVKVSKYLSKHLRHEPERLGLTLGAGGWVSVELFLEACARNRFPISREELEQVVTQSDKQRFAFDETGTQIRANQGHSVDVDL